MKVKQLQKRNGSWSDSFDLNFNSKNSLLLAFFDHTENWHSTIEEIKSKFPLATLVGCSSSGEIFNEFVYDKTFSMVQIQFENTQFKVFTTPIENAKQSYQFGEKLGEQLFANDLQYTMILSDGLNVSGTELVKGINSFLNQHQIKIPISGGLSGDGPRFQKTTLLHNYQMHSNLILAIGFYGQHLQIGTGSFGGWEEFGPKRIVSNSNDNVLFKIDDTPALNLYKNYLGDESQQLPASALKFPLSIKTDNSDKIVRTILSIDEQNQSMVFAGDIPEGAEVQLMRADTNKLVDAAAFAGKKSIENLNPLPEDSLAIAVSCVGRRLVLADRTDDELESLKNSLPDSTHLIGFYSYGELSPNDDLICALHNQTMTVTYLQEKKAS